VPISSSQQNVTRIAAHPAFPGIVALWLAVLFGLGTLVVPAPLLGKALLAAGVAAIVPAANPPIAFATQALMAGLAGATGAAAGWALARYALVPRKRPPARGRVRPLNAREELGELIDWTEAEPDSAGPEAGSGTPPPAHDMDLAEMMARLHRAIERRDARMAGAPVPAMPEPVAAETAAADTDGALRSVLHRLQQLRGAA